jgi:hypothetical protein
MKIPSGRVPVHRLVLVLLFLAPLVPPVTSSQSSAVSNAVSHDDRYDGPAELPREFVKSSLKDTPAHGKIAMVRSGENLEQALANASCGDTIELQAGAQFSGTFVLPEKKCDDAHWIIIRTSASDSSLPPEGTRLTPCYAGVLSLPGRSNFNCASTVNVLARIEFNGKGGSGPIMFSPGANHYRLIGLEITRAESSASVYNLIQFKGPADHVVFDRLWMHGTAQDETVRGVLLGPTRYVAIVDSFFTDFHCVAKTGSCVEAQAIGGGLGDNAMGPYKIVDNFLEAAGENIFFGGAATVTPTDIEIRRNHMFRPMSWKPGDPKFVGGRDGNPFIVKNLFELKNAQRVLMEGNVLENTWGGFTQAGFAILLTPKNQNNRCPGCRVTDVTIRYNRVMHMASGMQIANGLSDAGGASTDGGRYSIHDVVFEDIGGPAYGGYGVFSQISATNPPLHDIKLDHITAFPVKSLFMFGVRKSIPKISNFVFTNSIVGTGSQALVPTGGGPANCAFQPERQRMMGLLQNCFTGAIVTHNAIVGDGSGWPKGNMTFKNLQAVGFAVGDQERIVDYRLLPHSRCKQAGSDGKDLGADIAAVDSATAGVL